MDRRQFLKAAGLFGLSALVPRSLQAIGEASNVSIAQFDYGGERWDIRPNAIRRLLQEVEKRTSIAIDDSAPKVSAGDPDMFTQPFMTMLGDQSFEPLATTTVEKLRMYLQAGGFLFVDGADGLVDGPFIESVKREIGRIYPDKEISPIPSDHVLYKSFYLIDDPVGRVDITDRMWGIADGDRLPVVIGQNDLFGALAQDSFGDWEYAVSPGGEQQREMALRMGINLVMYALCVNYKSDQVHVPFILKRRKWRVD